jgi:hypothetical protein
MKSSASGTGPPKELAQLLRLRKVRVDAAEALVRERRAECEASDAAVQARRERIEADRREVERHAAFVVGDGARDLPRLAASFQAFRAMLGDRLERSEYGLIDDQETLEQSQSTLLDARQAWLREQARRDGIQEALVRSRRALALQREARAEDEVDELRRGGPLPSPSRSRSNP